MNNKRKIIAILIFLFIFFYLKIEVIAKEELSINYTEEFSNWLELTEEEKEETNIPSIYSINVPDKYFEENINKENFWDFFKRLIGLEKKVESKYILSQDIDISVKNQGITNACWAFSILSSMETNMALRKNEYKDFSERHMMYATSRNFLDGINKNGFNKQAYDRINLTVKKGKRELIQSAAAELGESTNAFINRLIDAELERMGQGGNGFTYSNDDTTM